MKVALLEARKALKKDEVPIGCIIVDDDRIIARGHNLRETRSSPLAHAEILCIEKAAKKKGNWRLDSCELYVTTEPCPMCLGAILQSRIRALYYGAIGPRTGSLVSRLNLPEFYPIFRKIKVQGGILEAEAQVLIQEFFRKIRQNKSYRRHPYSPGL